MIFRKVRTFEDLMIEPKFEVLHSPILTSYLAFVSNRRNREFSVERFKAQISVDSFLMQQRADILCEYFGRDFPIKVHNHCRWLLMIWFQADCALLCQLVCCRVPPSTADGRHVSLPTLPSSSEWVRHHGLGKAVRFISFMKFQDSGRFLWCLVLAASLFHFLSKHSRVEQRV